MQLGWLPKHNITHIVSRKDLVVNPVMLGYWKKYINIIDDEIKIHKLSPIRKYVGMDSCMVATLNNKPVYIEHANG